MKLKIAIEIDLDTEAGRDDARGEVRCNLAMIAKAVDDALVAKTDVALVPLFDGNEIAVGAARIEIG